MHRLTRETRFNLTPGTPPGPGGNGHAGTPPADGPTLFWVLRVTVAGEPAASGYLIDIKAIDRAVRERAGPVLADAAADGIGVAGAAGRAYDTLRDAWPGVSVDRVELAVSPFQSAGVSAKAVDMVRLSHHFEFSASHRLHDASLTDAENAELFGKCNNAAGHGHNYEVRVTLEGTPDASGRLIGIAELERLVNSHAIEKLDHKHLNAQVAAFATTNPSVENIARVIYGLLKQPLARPNAKLASVTVWETPKTSCEYGEEA